MPSATDSTRRFTDRVANYVRYRPAYPAALLETLRERARLTPASVVADVGSGTGILAALLLPLVRRVYAVEPNDAMRAAAEAWLGSGHGAGNAAGTANGTRGAGEFVSVAATAEATTLPEASVDLVTAGQAFHWFDHAAARREFARILRPGGHVALVWNERETDTTPFLRSYEALLQQHARDYGRVKHTNVDETAIAAFFAPERHECIETANEQRFDLDGLVGRSLSSSYAPNPGQPGHEAFVAALRNLFAAHAEADGRVSFRYRTRLYFGRL
ncbi:methylase involved in ubiquinone/menaquinone biosynthesis [Opitutaceae bacterium TAV1]|nr:methyltransferase [Opitutaceae bacterium TAV5]EIP99149.1 methylase involved in ubiquinone/menaquinone biosynthesis [Opitutaceae bacterium TAV1]